MALTPGGPHGSAGSRRFRVRELNLEVATLLRRSFGAIEVTGEISEFKRHHPSGHLYFSLVDQRAVLRCVMYRDEAAHLEFDPAPGLEVVARGRLTIYLEQGTYQLLVDRLWPGGAGAAQAKLEALKKKLLTEGLFDPSRKRRLPRFPQVVGIVTSRSGAAVVDIVRILQSRWPSIEILFTPVIVQGPDAPGSIVSGIRQQARHGRADVLIVGRGGGSIEDLAAFNDERVVRAVASCPIPIVSAVGHEIDVTLCDLAADVRAATPSRAAELAVPDRQDVLRHVRGLDERVRGSVHRQLDRQRRHLDHLARGRGLYEPQLALEGAVSRVDALREELLAAAKHLGPDRASVVDRLGRRLGQGHATLVSTATRHVDRVRADLAAAAQRVIAERRPVIAHAGGKLDSLNPVAVLDRGYALVAAEDGSLVRDGQDLRSGHTLHLRFARGGAEARVTKSWGAPPDGADEDGTTGRRLKGKQR
jgi:exodeoxyribonuclease VII large subunit